MIISKVLWSMNFHHGVAESIDDFRKLVAAVEVPL
jgi:hypothetical protein